jgi:hypothetical protein
MALRGWKDAVFGLTVIGVLGCGGGNGTPVSTDCAAWMIERAAESSSTYALESGALVLRRPGPTGPTASLPLYNGDDLAFSQAGLTGDFDVKVEWEGLQTGGGVWSQIEAGVWWNDPVSGNVYQISGSVGGGAGAAVIVNLPQVARNNTNIPVTASALDGASGSFRLTRTATAASSTTTVNGQAAAAPATAALPDATYTLFIGVGIGPNSSDNDQHNEESIRIARVTVSAGGGTVKSDEFACAALP